MEGGTRLGPGLLSRDGWTVVDDSERPLFDDSPWPWVMPRPAGDRQDLYFFGYGHAYRQALHDFTLTAGKIPMPPRFAFGTWWSRYWSYTDEEFRDLVHQFEIFSVPLDVLVIDMDWHLTFGITWDDNTKDESGHTKGWTGFTWDPNYFPDPAGFLKWTDVHGLRTPLNLHPASGIQPWESQYPAMARAMGIDPASQKYVPFDIVDKFFDDYEQSEITKGKVKAEVDLDKRTSMLEFHFRIAGNVTIICDRCLDEFEMPIEYEATLFVKFGDTSEEQTDEIIVLSHNEFEIDVAQYIYEFVHLSLPYKRVHPNDSKGRSTCNKEMLKKLDEYIIRENKEDNDPRWDDLQNLLN